MNSLFSVGRVVSYFLLVIMLALPLASYAACGMMVGTSLVCTNPSNPTTDACFYVMKPNGTYTCSETCPQEAKFKMNLLQTPRNFAGRYCLASCPWDRTGLGYNADYYNNCLSFNDYNTFTNMVIDCKNTQGRNVEALRVALEMVTSKCKECNNTGVGYSGTPAQIRLEAWWGKVRAAKAVHFEVDNMVRSTNTSDVATCKAYLPKVQPVLDTFAKLRDEAP